MECEVFGQNGVVYCVACIEVGASIDTWMIVETGLRGRGGGERAYWSRKQ